MKSWITVIGIGEDGLEGLTNSSHQLIIDAEVLIGAVRHLEKIPDYGSLRITWGERLFDIIKTLNVYKSKKLVILASGDPLEYGIGATLLKVYAPSEIKIIPHQSAFNLAASRMRWPLVEVERVTLHGRALGAINYYLRPGAKILILSWDKETPRKLASHLVSVGFGGSKIKVFEYLGGKGEKKFQEHANNWFYSDGADLNTIALDCKADVEAKFWPRLAGLPEEAFEHDGNITKREIRAITLAALSPFPGQMLWDIGAGTGAIGIEWLRTDLSCNAIAIERNKKRCEVIKRNANRLGVPHLQIFECTAPGSLLELKQNPDAIFLGGGVSHTGLLKFSWKRLKKRGCLVANAVTLEAQKSLFELQSKIGGDFTKVSISRSDLIGKMKGLQPMREVLQLKAQKL
jgi:precorrin-6Y C5,15-methyltransferase (decarboxylating)